MLTWQAEKFLDDHWYVVQTNRDGFEWTIFGPASEEEARARQRELEKAQAEAESSNEDWWRA